MHIKPLAISLPPFQVSHVSLLVTMIKNTFAKHNHAIIAIVSKFLSWHLPQCTPVPKNSLFLVATLLFYVSSIFEWILYLYDA